MKRLLEPLHITTFTHDLLPRTYLHYHLTYVAIVIGEGYFHFDLK